MVRIFSVEIPVAVLKQITDNTPAGCTSVSVQQLAASDKYWVDFIEDSEDFRGPQWWMTVYSSGLIDAEGAWFDDDEEAEY